MTVPAEIIHRLERRVRRLQVGMLVMGFAAVGLAMGGLRQAEPQEIRARSIELVDDQGVVRLLLGQDTADGQRRSRAVGLTLYGKDGSERGGFSTMEDDSVVLGMDAPQGVGAPMRDRVGMVVYPSGASQIWLIDNQTSVPVRIHSRGDGGGGIDLMNARPNENRLTRRTLTYGGDATTETKLDPNKP